MTVEFKREGLTLEITAAQAYTKDLLYDLGGGLFGVSVNTYAIGDTAVFRVSGVYELPLAAAATAAIGAPAYYDVGNTEVTDDALFPAVGRFRNASTGATAQVDLNDMGGPSAVAAFDNSATPYTLGSLSKDAVLNVDTQAGAVTVNLPAAAGVTGRMVTVKRAGTGVNAITVEPDGSETIDGAANHTDLDAQYDVLTLVSDGSNWLIVSSVIA